MSKDINSGGCRLSEKVVRLSRVEVDRSRLVLAIILNFVLWGSGGLLLKRGRADLFALFLHIYIYFLFWLYFTFLGLWLLWFPVAALGGAYFALDLGRRFKPTSSR